MLIARAIDDSGLFGALHTFYFSELLEPSTTYTVTIVYGTPNSTRTWNFTTSSEIPEPPPVDRDDPFDIMPIFLLIIVIVIISVIVIGLYLSGLKKKRKKLTFDILLFGVNLLSLVVLGCFGENSDILLPVSRMEYN